MRSTRHVTLCVFVASAVVLAACGSSGNEAAVKRVPLAARSVLVAPATAPPPPADYVAPETTPAAPVPDERFTVDAYRVFGVWVDVFDWAGAYTSNPIGLADIDVMAAEGAQTLYIQTNRFDHPDDVLEPEQLDALISHARGHGLKVVAWYLPTLVDPATDLRRLLLASELDVDGIAVDIESLEVDDVDERTRRLVDLSTELRHALPDQAIGAIVLEPVVMEDVNPNYWPGYPWAEMAPLYDVWLPMAYWTNRVGPWRSAHDYIATNVERVRERIGHSDALVHAVGGVGDETTVADLEAMLTAVATTEPIGASIYDYRTTKPEHWALLRQFRR